MRRPIPADTHYQVRNTDPLRPRHLQLHLADEGPGKEAARRSLGMSAAASTNPLDLSVSRPVAVLDPSSGGGRKDEVRRRANRRPPCKISCFSSARGSVRQRKEEAANGRTRLPCTNMVGKSTYTVGSNVRNLQRYPDRRKKKKKKKKKEPSRRRAPSCLMPMP